MRSSRLQTLLFTALLAGAAACIEDTSPGGPAIRLAPLGALSITVQSFALPLMTDSCYAVTVYATDDPALFDAAHEVWSEPRLCASEYGSGTHFLDLLGTCDPLAPGAGHVNAVRLELVDLYLDGEAGGEGVVLSPDFYANPCPVGGNDCVLTAPCVENQSTPGALNPNGSAPVDFNLAVVGHPDLGIFDTRVSLGDVFCAAKLDCVDNSGDTLYYLPEPATGSDGATAVFGFSCSAGLDASETYLYLDDLVVTCRDGFGAVTRTATIDPTAGPGPVTPTQAGTPTATDVLYGAAVNRGAAANGAAYWNVLLGLSLDGPADETCRLTTAGTASAIAFADGATPHLTRYPVIHWDVPLSLASARACTRHPLDASGDDVATDYTSLHTPWPFTHQLARGTTELGTVTTFTPAP